MAVVVIILSSQQPSFLSRVWSLDCELNGELRRLQLIAQPEVHYITGGKEKGMDSLLFAGSMIIMSWKLKFQPHLMMPALHRDGIVTNNSAERDLRRKNGKGKVSRARSHH